MVADGETLEAGTDLSDLVAEADQVRLDGSFLVDNALRDQVFGAQAPVVAGRFIAFDSERVRVPDGERTLTLRWTMPDGEVLTGSATFAYAR